MGSRKNEIILELNKKEKVLKEVYPIEDRVLAALESYLTEAERCKILSLYWDNESMEMYFDRVLYVLMDSYRVFDQSHLRYPKLLAIFQTEMAKAVEEVKIEKIEAIDDEIENFGKMAHSYVRANMETDLNMRKMRISEISYEKWLARIKADHEAKLKRCKVSVYPIEGALTK